MVAAAPVVIELAPQVAALPEARVLANACTEALHDRRPCVLEDAAKEAAYAVVIVSWEGPGRTAATIEVGVRRAARADWVTRHVDFSASDPEDERWRSVGLVVATLVDQAGGESPAAQDVTRPQEEGKAPNNTAPGAAWLLDAAVEAARGSAAGLGAWGGVLRASRQLGSLPLYATGSLRYEMQAQAGDGTIAQVAMRWAWASAGIAVATDLAGAPFRLEARLEPTVGWVQATATSSASSASGAFGGLREGVGATWWLARPVGLVVGAELVEAPPASVGVSPTGAPPYQTVTKEEWLGWSTMVGLRLRVE
jgi:hypothetical protein